MTKRVIFESGWESFFESHQLRAFDDFFEFVGGQRINLNSKRNVVVFELEGNSQPRIFFMKRFIKPHFKDMLSAFCHFGTLCSQAEVEFRNAKILLENKIETYHPVCYGFQTCLGIEQKSFFITEKINGPCLLDYLAQSWKNLSQAEKQAFVIKIAHFFQRIHSAGIRLPDSYIWHVYMVQKTDTADAFEFGMIDLHRMQIRTHNRQQAAKDIGGFLFSLPDGFMDGALRLLFMDHYLENHHIKNTDAFRKQVKQWERKISSRRKREIERI